MRKRLAPTRRRFLGLAGSAATISVIPIVGLRPAEATPETMAAANENVRVDEFLHVLRGEFELWLHNDGHYRLKAGDSLYFESSTPHRWKNPGRAEAWILWVNTPPTF